MNTQIPFYVISAERAELSLQENGDRSNWLGVLLRDAGLQFEIALGSYKGITERSFIVYVPELLTSQTKERINRLTRLFNQETFIHVDAGRWTHLYNGRDGSFEGMLGKWQELELPAAATGWTKTADGRYWAAA